MSVLQLFEEGELELVGSLEEGPGSVPRARYQVLVTLRELKLHHGQGVSGEFAGRYRGLALSQVPNDDVRILLVLGLACTGCTVALVGSCNTKDFKGMSV